MKVARKVQVIISQFQQFRHKTNSSAFTNRRLIVLLLRYFATGSFSTIISFVNYAYRVIPDSWATSYFDIMEGIWPTHRRHVFVVRQVAAPGAKSAVSDCILLMCVVKCLFVLIMCPVSCTCYTYWLLCVLYVYGCMEKKISRVPWYYRVPIGCC